MGRALVRGELEGRDREDIQTASYRESEGRSVENQGGGGSSVGRERTVYESQGCGLLPLAEMDRSWLCMQAEGRYTSGFSSVAVEGGVPETETNKTVIIEAHFCAGHWCKTLGGVLVEESQRPIGMIGAWEREVARLLRALWGWGSCSHSRDLFSFMLLSSHEPMTGPVIQTGIATLACP